MCLEPPDLLDLDDTDEEVNTELLSLLNLQSGEGEGDGVVQPMGLATSGHGPCCIVVPALSHGVTSNDYT